MPVGDLNGDGQVNIIDIIIAQQQGQDIDYIVDEIYSDPVDFTSNYNVGLNFSNLYDEFMQTGDQTSINQYFDTLIDSIQTPDMMFDQEQRDDLYEQLIQTEYYRPQLGRYQREYQMGLSDLDTQFMNQDRSRQLGQTGLTFGSGISNQNINLDAYSGNVTSLRQKLESQRNQFFSGIGSNFWDIISTTTIPLMGGNEDE